MLAVDGRPLYVEDALVAVELPRNRWRLVHASRNPKDTVEARRRWEIMDVSDGNVTGSKDFKHRPTEHEVDAFLKSSLWYFHPRVFSFEVISC